MSGPNHPRGTSNTNDRGSAAGRRARRDWLVETFRADVDLPDFETDLGLPRTTAKVPLGHGQAACRCYRCAALLTVDTVTVDRILPGCKGGTYRRNNIRPACGRCNSITGNQVRKAIKAAKAA